MLPEHESCAGIHTFLVYVKKETNKEITELIYLVSGNF
jgi:hypothetical protein